MPIDILMPALSPTMEEGTLAKWLVKEGDAVSSGDVLAEIETDKATMELESINDGKVAKILVPEGTEGVKVNEIIARLIEEGESAEAAETKPAAKALGRKDLLDQSRTGSHHHRSPKSLYKPEHDKLPYSIGHTTEQRTDRGKKQAPGIDIAAAATAAKLTHEAQENSDSQGVG